jgi:Eukaryotic membrane protein family
MQYCVDEQAHVRRLYSTASSLSSAPLRSRVDLNAKETSCGDVKESQRFGIRLSSANVAHSKQKERERAEKQRKKEERPCRCAPATSTAPQHATDFLFVPITLERVIMSGLFICLDSFLFVLTALPVRALIAIYSFAIAALVAVYRRLSDAWDRKRRARKEVKRRRPMANDRAEAMRRLKRLRKMRGIEKVHGVEKIDVLRAALILMSYAVIRDLDVTVLTAFIRRGLFKLRMMVTLVEVVDRLLISFGSNILGVCFWHVYYLGSGGDSNDNDGERLPKTTMLRMALLTAGAVFYLSLHATFLLLHLSLIEVSVDSGSNALISLLILIQFAEMKSGVLKSLTLVKLRGILFADVVERFQMLVFVCIAFFYKAARHADQPLASWAPSTLSALVTIYLSELIVDWVKCMSICNYSGISPHFYSEVGSQFMKALGRAPNNSVLTDNTFSVSREFGLFPIALAVVFLKVAGADWLAQLVSRERNVYALGALLWLVLWLLKFFSSYCLRQLAHRYRVYRKIRKIPELRRQTSTFARLFLVKPPAFADFVSDSKKRQ